MSDRLDDLLDRPIAFQRAYAKIAGSVTAGLMLSQAVYWSSRGSDPDGWFWKTQEEWYEETTLSRYEQEGARKKLMTIVSPSGRHIWREQRRGVPAKLYYRLDKEALKECLLCADKYAEKPHTGLMEIPDLDGGKTTNKIAEKPQSLYTEITSETTTEITSETTPTRVEDLDHHHHSTRAQNAESPTAKADDDDGLPQTDIARELALDIAKDVPGWVGFQPFIEGLDDKSLSAAVGWLWLWQTLCYTDPSVDDPRDRIARRSRYPCDPFADVKSIPGKIVTQVRLGNAAPLHEVDARSLAECLAQWADGEVRP